MGTQTHINMGNHVVFDDLFDAAAGTCESLHLLLDSRAAACRAQLDDFLISCSLDPARLADPDAPLPSLSLDLLLAAQPESDDTPKGESACFLRPAPDLPDL